MQVTAYVFGPFRFDPAERQLWRDNELVPLTPKAFDTLQALIARAGRAVRKDELMATVWPDTNVGDATLAQNIFALRKALGDPGAIETVPKFGYRFTLAVSEPPRSRSCCLQWDARQFPLRPGENIVGRDPEVGIPLDSTTISRRHARITVSAIDALLEDLGSKNGTFVGGVRVTAPVRLADGDLVGFGSLVLTFYSRPPLMSTETQSSTKARERT